MPYRLIISCRPLAFATSLPWSFGLSPEYLNHILHFQPSIPYGTRHSRSAIIYRHQYHPSTPVDLFNLPGAPPSVKMKTKISLKSLKKAIKGAKPQSKRANGADRQNSKAPTPKQGDSIASQQNTGVAANCADVADDSNDNGKGGKLSRASRKLVPLMKYLEDKICDVIEKIAGIPFLVCMGLVILFVIVMEGAL